MPKMALADLMFDWHRLLVGTGDEETGDDPKIQELRRRLAEQMARARFLAGEQNELIGRQRQITQALQIAKTVGTDVAIELRLAIKAVLGHRYEGLVKYNVKPTRRRSRRIRLEDVIPTFPVPDLTERVEEMLDEADGVALRSGPRPSLAVPAADEP